MIINYKLFLENIQKALKEFPNDKEIIEEINSKLKNKHYVYTILKIHHNSFTIDIDNIIKEFEKYLDTKTYLTLDLDNILYKQLKDRNNLLFQIKEYLPTNFLKNNSAIRDKYTIVGDRVSYFLSCYTNNILNKNENTKKKIDSVISASNKTLDELIDLVEDKYSVDKFDTLINKSVFDNIEESSDGLIYESDILWVNDEKTKYLVKIDSLEAMIFIGQNTFWCHTHKDAYHNYSTYTYYGKTLVFINYTIDDVENICVATNNLYSAYYDDVLEELFDLYDDDKDEYDSKIEELDDGNNNEMIFNRHNEPLGNPIFFLKSFFGDWIDNTHFGSYLDE